MINLSPAKKNRLTNNGFTLVEMMVAVVLSVILTMGVGYFVHATLYAVQDVKSIALMECAANVFYRIKEDIVSSDSINVNGGQNTLTLESTTYTIHGQELRRDGFNLLPAWDNGGIYLVTADSSFVRGIDVDGNGSLSSRENNMAQVILVLKCIDNGTEILRRTFVQETLCDDDDYGRFK